MSLLFCIDGEGKANFSEMVTKIVNLTIAS